MRVANGARESKMTRYPGNMMLYAHRNRSNHLNHILGCKINAMGKIIDYIKEERNSGATQNSITFLSNID